MATLVLLGIAGNAAAQTRTAGEGRVPAFYAQTAKSSRLGQLIARQPLGADLVPDAAVRGIRFLYTSADGSAGRSQVTVSAVLLLPRGAPPKGAWPLIAWAHGSVGLADVCAPSLQGRSLRDIVYLNRWLAEGYAIVATDYQSLGTPGHHPYMNARAAAYSVLDSVRVVQRAGLPIGNRVAVVGPGANRHGGSAIGAALYPQTGWRRRGRPGRRCSTCRHRRCAFGPRGGGSAAPQSAGLGPDRECARLRSVYWTVNRRPKGALTHI